MTLDVVGDRWSLLIVRSMLFAKYRTFKELRGINEKIATNILADRLENLEKNGIIAKLPDLMDKRRSIYELTEKGIELMPILLSMIEWGMQYNPDAWIPMGTIKETVRTKTQLVKRARRIQLP